MITWDDSLITGQPQIDQEHQVLVERLNELEQAMLDGKEREVIEPLVQFLDIYAKHHFRSEEACFTKLACPFAEENAQGHRYFTETLASLRSRMADQGPTDRVVLDVYRKLVDWIRSHIMKTDCKVRHYGMPA